MAESSSNSKPVHLYKSVDGTWRYDSESSEDPNFPQIVFSPKKENPILKTPFGYSEFILLAKPVAKSDQTPTAKTQEAGPEKPEEPESEAAKVAPMPSELSPDQPVAVESVDQNFRFSKNNMSDLVDMMNSGYRTAASLPVMDALQPGITNQIFAPEAYAFRLHSEAAESTDGDLLLFRWSDYLHACTTSQSNPDFDHVLSPALLHYLVYASEKNNAGNYCWHRTNPIPPDLKKDGGQFDDRRYDVNTPWTYADYPALIAALDLAEKQLTSGNGPIAPEDLIKIDQNDPRLKIDPDQLKALAQDLDLAEIRMYRDFLKAKLGNPILDFFVDQTKNFASILEVGLILTVMTLFAHNRWPNFGRRPVPPVVPPPSADNNGNDGGGGGARPKGPTGGGGRVAPLLLEVREPLQIEGAGTNSELVVDLVDNNNNPVQHKSNPIPILPGASGTVSVPIVSSGGSAKTARPSAAPVDLHPTVYNASADGAACARFGFDMTLENAPILSSKEVRVRIQPETLSALIAAGLIIQEAAFVAYQVDAQTQLRFYQVETGIFYATVVVFPEFAAPILATHELAQKVGTLSEAQQAAVTDFMVQRLGMAADDKRIEFLFRITPILTETAMLTPWILETGALVRSGASFWEIASASTPYAMVPMLFVQMDDFSHRAKQANELYRSYDGFIKHHPDQIELFNELEERLVSALKLNTFTPFGKAEVQRSDVQKAWDLVHDEKYADLVKMAGPILSQGVLNLFYADNLEDVSFSQEVGEIFRGWGRREKNREKFEREFFQLQQYLNHPDPIDSLCLAESSH